ncbi:OmpA family protein [Maritimibacter alkaliphilus]|uniref:OmpA family protein n=1 Tax=Maritimibacter alkaliphilus TaxID=404236 RepID=UPI001C9487D2|nr:OmpA family protein [Maritimibacter alkaliphilus]MBY6093082.1 OmpA family protein [Maritimibacter alkaliphilus]
MPSIIRRPAERRLRPLALLLALALPGAATAQALNLPANARQIAADQERDRSYALPIGPWADHAVPMQSLEGDVTREVWRVEARGETVLQLIAPLRDQLQAAGYEVLLDCADRQCGGFDFRFALEVAPAPDMYVDLFDFHVLTAQRALPGTAAGAASPGDAEHVQVIASRSGFTGYLQIDRITPAGEAPPPPDVPATAGGTGDALITRLEEAGHVVLADLNFATGASDLSEGAYASLDTLAAYLAADPARQVALVGHTDSEGALETNIALSQRRAASVRDRLVNTHGTAPGQVSAEGVGFLAPLAPNTTQAGRESNRRVEAVLLSPGAAAQ